MSQKTIYKLLISWIIFIIICVGIIYYVKYTTSKDGDNTNTVGQIENTNTGEVGSTAHASTQATTEFVEEAASNPLEKNRYKTINRLITQVLEASVACDMDKLKSLDTYKGAYDDAQYKQLAKVIKGYEDIECYTKKGLEPNTYIVFAVANTVVKDVKTKAPTMYRYYVVKDTDGKYKINTDPDLDATISNYIQKVNTDEDTLSLCDEVNLAFEKACNEDEDLKEFVK